MTPDNNPTSEPGAEAPKRKVDPYLGYLHMLRSLQDYYKQRLWRLSPNQTQYNTDIEKIIDSVQPLGRNWLPLSLAKMFIPFSTAKPFNVVKPDIKQPEVVNGDLNANQMEQKDGKKGYFLFG